MELQGSIRIAVSPSQRSCRLLQSSDHKNRSHKPSPSLPNPHPLELALNGLFAPRRTRTLAFLLLTVLAASSTLQLYTAGLGTPLQKGRETGAGQSPKKQGKVLALQLRS